MRLALLRRRAGGQPRHAPIPKPRVPTPDTPDHIARINDLTRVAKANWFSLLAYLAFTGVTLLGVEDIDFFLGSRQTQLPLIGVQIPTREFFLFGPILGAALYAYLHIYLAKLWEALAVAEARPGGEPLAVQVAPWLVTDLGLAMRRDGAFRIRPFDWLSHIASLLLVFLAGPVVMWAFWVWSWPLHDLPLSLILGGLFALTILVMLGSLHNAVTRLWLGCRYKRGFLHLRAIIPAILIGVPVGVVTVLKADGYVLLGLREVTFNRGFDEYAE